MTEYLNLIFDEIIDNNGRKFNKLIDLGIINYKEVLDNLLKDGSSNKLYLFAKYIKKVNKEEKLVIVNELIRRKAIVELFNFARFVEDAPISIIESGIINSKIEPYICAFAMEVEGANISLLEKAIIDLGNAEGIYRFAINIEKADINNLASAIIKTNHAHYICLFAISIPNANLELFEESIVNIGDINEYKKFLEYKKKVQDEQFKELNESIKDNDYEEIELNKEKYAYLFKEPSNKAKALVKKIDNRGY